MCIRDRTRGQYLGDCVRLYAIVTLEKNNNSIVEWTELYTSASFLPGQQFAEYSERYCHPPPQYANWGGGFISGWDYLLFLGLFLVFGLAIIYSQAKLTSWHFTGSYSNKSTQYLAILVSAILFIFLTMFPVAFCIAAIVLFAQFIAYSTGHYDKPEVSEEDQPKPK